MKVIERKEIEKGFDRRHTCARCESVLHVESSDLCHKPAGGDQRDWEPESFSATCAVCGISFTVPSDKIPEYVKHLARERRANVGGYFDR